MRISFVLCKACSGLCKPNIIRNNTRIFVNSNPLLKAIINQNVKYYHTNSNTNFIFSNNKSTTDNSKENNNETPTNQKSIWGSATGTVGGLFNQVKESINTATETLSQTEIIKSLNGIVNYLKELNIEKLFNDTQTKSLQLIEDSKLNDNEGTTINKEEENIKTEQRKLILSFNEILNNKDNPIHQMKVEKSGITSLLNYIPYFHYIELMFKYVILQSMNILIEIILYSNKYTAKEKEAMVNEISNIIIKNSLDPFSLGVEIMEYTVAKVGGDEVIASRISGAVKLIPYMKSVVNLIRKVKPF
ncbi:hypothetical protein ABK040_013886 [Willaertia magna]